MSACRSVTTSNGERELKILILGGGGMLGHKVFQTLQRRFPDVWCTIRAGRDQAPWQNIPLFQSDRVRDGIDASRVDQLDALLRDLRPTVVVNCVGAIKQRAEAREAIPSITLNALLPHRLAAFVKTWGGRVIHFSTDCVFSGNKGNYTESDAPDADDLYGKTKHLGELTDDHTVTLRTSFIGRELQHFQSLLEWLLAQNHRPVRGYRRVWWSGVTSNHLAEVVADVIERHPRLHGLYHLSSGRISKYDLLIKLRDGLRLDIEVEPEEGVECDRSLDGRRFEAATAYRCPPWDALIRQLADDPTPYDAWTEKHEVTG
jgi:dTDP-4-dehydrorhamnose reductase